MHNRHAVFAASVLTLAVAAALRGQTSAAPAASPLRAMADSPLPDPGGPDAVWRNASKSPDDRARDVLKRLTLDEKIALVHADGTFTSAGVPRLGIGKLWMSDGPEGVREEIQPSGWNAAGHIDDFATAMPANISLAATWDPELGKAYGNVIGEEAFVRNKNIMLSAGMDTMRTPLNGRNSEYLGEDPFLSSRMAVGVVEGIQSKGVAACVKHYALNDQETNRNSVNAKADERTMREIYLAPFKAAVVEGHALAIMSAYNRINGDYASENDFLINKVLKGDWGFQGLVMTDWGGTHSTAKAANAGLDLEMGSNVTGSHSNDFLAGRLQQAVLAGDVPMSRLDDMALRNLRVLAATGNFDGPRDTAAAKDSWKLMSPEHLAAARKVADAGIVLLKNDKQVLPIDPAKVKTIAIIGDNAKAKFAADGDSARIKTKQEITPFDGITEHVANLPQDKSPIKITYAQGYARAGGGRGAFGGGGFGRGAGGAGAPGSAAPAGNQALIDEAVAAAKASDVAIVVAGLYRSQDQEGRDRSNMDLPQGQAELIKAVVAANPKTIVILNGGSPSVVSPWVDNAAGLVMYWYGGSEGGNALADVLFGDVNPSGHLPCTWGKQLTDYAANSDGPEQYPGITPGAQAGAGGARGRGGAGGGFGGGAPLTPDTGPQVSYSEGVFVGYRWFDEKKIEPQFPFGYGLSYTTFAMQNLVASRLTSQAVNDLGAVAQVTVKNTGKIEGAQVVQVYVSQNSPAVPRPPKELKGFTKVSLRPGEEKTVSVHLDAAAFTHYDPDKHGWVAEAGDYTISVGDSSRNTPLKATIKLDKPIFIKEGS